MATALSFVACTTTATADQPNDRATNKAPTQTPTAPASPAPTDAAGNPPQPNPDSDPTTNPDPLIGTQAPGWSALPTPDGTSLAFADIPGRLRLIRFWTDGCPHCEASAPTFTTLHRDFAARGLTVIGVFHPKPRGAHRPATRVRERADEFGFTFPIVIDDDWATLDTWWLSTGDRRATSVSFLVDEHNVIQWIHPGPELHPDGPADHESCRRDYAQLREVVTSLLNPTP